MIKMNFLCLCISVENHLWLLNFFFLREVVAFRTPPLKSRYWGCRGYNSVEKFLAANTGIASYQRDYFDKADHHN